MIEAIVIRPEPGCTQSLSALEDMDIPALGFPLFEVRPLPWEMVEPESFDALLIGTPSAVSPNASMSASSNPTMS